MKKLIIIVLVFCAGLAIGIGPARLLSKIEHESNYGKDPIVENRYQTIHLPEEDKWFCVAILDTVTGHLWLRQVSIAPGKQCVFSWDTGTNEEPTLNFSEWHYTTP